MKWYLYNYDYYIYIIHNNPHHPHHRGNYLFALLEKGWMLKRYD